MTQREDGSKVSWDSLLRDIASKADLPKELFHYTTANALIGIVHLKTIRASHASFSNDSQETKLGLELIERIGGTILPTIEDSRFAHGLFQAVLQRVQEDTAPYIFCLTGEENDLSQWRAYGGDGSGFCIGFDAAELERLTFTNGRGSVQLGKVRYEQADQERIARTGLEWSAQAFRREDKDHFRGAQIMLQNMATWFKNKAFKKENEWRLACGPYDAHQLLKFRERGGVPVPYHELIHPSGLLPIKSIWIGPHRNPEEAERGVKILLQSATYNTSDIRIRRSEIPHRSF